MAKDVVIIPASGSQSFRNNTIEKASIFIDNSDSLIISGSTISISSPNMVEIGAGGGDLYVGDGINPTNIIFEQNGSIKGVDSGGVTLTLGSPSTDLRLLGTPLAPTAVAGTNTFQIATTAFIANSISNLGLGALATLSSIDLTTGTSATTLIVSSSNGTNAILPAATTTVAGVLTGVDKLKLDGISANSRTGTVTSVATSNGTGISVTGSPITTSGTLTITNTAPNVSTNLTTTTAATTVTVNSSDGTNALIPAATTTVAGVLTGTDKLKLDGIAAGATNVTNTNQLTNGAGYITGYTESDTLASVVSRGNTANGGIVIEGSVASGGTNFAGYRNGGDNLVLKGNASGVSGIFFQSEKDGVNINHPSDFGYIQYHAYGIDGTTGESNKLIIGVANDSTDTVVLQSPYINGVKISYLNATNGTGSTEATVWHVDNLTNLNQLTNGPGYSTTNGTVTSVATTNGTGISVTGGPITTSGTLTITNTAPNVTTNLSTTTTATTVTVNSSDGTNATLPAATTTVAGVQTGADKLKLDGIASGAQVNVATNLGYTTAASTGTVTSSTGTNSTLPAATTSLAGLLTGTDKTKLDGIASGATANTNTGTVTSVATANGTGITVTGGPITSTGTLTITNTAPNVTTNLSTTTAATTVTVNSSDGTNALIPAATTTIAGVLTGADKGKLDGIAAGATANTGTVTSVATAGGYQGLTLTGGPITTSGTITLGGAPTGTWPISISGTATKIENTVVGTVFTELVRGNMADNDQFRIGVGGTASNQGYVEIATADDGTEPIYVRQYSGVFTTIVKSATLLDGSGNTSFPGTISSNGTLLTGNTGTVTSVATTNGTGITVTGGPITTSGTLTITNTAPNVTTNLSTTTTATTVTVNSSDGTNATLPAATTTVAGVLTATTQGIAGVKTFTNGFIDEVTNIGKITTPYEVIATGAWALPIGSSRFIQPTSVGGTGEPGYWFTTGRRDTGGGYSGILTSFSNTNSYIGNATTSGANPTWNKILTDSNFIAGTNYQTPLSNLAFTNVNNNFSVAQTFASSITATDGRFSGNVGIGTTNPSEKLDVAGTILSTKNVINNFGGGSALDLVFSGVTVGEVRTRDYDLLVGTPTGGAQALAFQTNGIERARFANSTGNLLIGTTTDNGSKLQVTGAATFASSITATDGIFSGNVGIGVTNPISKLEVLTNFKIRNPSELNTRFNFGWTNSNSIAYLDAYNFSTGTRPSVAIQPDGGNLLIGTTADNGSKLQVAGAATFSSNVTANGGFRSSGDSFTQNAGGLFFNGVGSFGSGILSDTAGTALKLQSGGGVALLLEANRAATFNSIVTANGGQTVVLNGSNGSVTFGANQGGGGVIKYNSNGNLDIIPRSGYSTTFASSIVIAGDISGDGSATLKTYWGGAYGGGFQIKTDGATVDRYSRFGMISNSKQWVGGMIINNDTSATFTSSVTATAFFGPSDMRLKTLVEKVHTNSVANISEISYLWKDESMGKRIQVGYDASVVKEHMPNAVNTDAKGMLSVNYIQVLVAKVAALEEQVKKLQNGI